MPYIENYSFGSITIDGETYRSDVIIFPDRVESSWWRKEGHLLQNVDLISVIAAKPDVLVVGTGASGIMQIAPEVEKRLRQEGIALRVCRTEEACKVYNDLCSRSKVVAALHLTC